MKFSNLLLFTGAATASFYLVKNRKKSWMKLLKPMIL